MSLLDADAVPGQPDTATSSPFLPRPEELHSAETPPIMCISDPQGRAASARGASVQYIEAEPFRHLQGGESLTLQQPWGRTMLMRIELCYNNDM